MEPYYNQWLLRDCSTCLFCCCSCFRILCGLSATCWHRHMRCRLRQRATECITRQQVSLHTGVWRYGSHGRSLCSFHVRSFQQSLQIRVLACNSDGLILDYANGLSPMLMVSALNKTVHADLNVRVAHWHTRNHCDGEGLHLYDLLIPTTDNTVWFMVMCAYITLLI